MRDNEWRDIETAPKDGTEILTFGRAGMIVAAWDKHENWWACYNCGYVENGPRKAPDFWMPLPPPPLRTSCPT